MQHSFKAEKSEHDSYLQNIFPFKQNFINVENNNDILGLKIINSSSCQNTQLSNISPESDISDLFSQSSNTINDDYKSNVNILQENILSTSQNIVNNSPIDIGINSNIANTISFQRHLDNNFNSNSSYISTHLPGVAIIQTCNNNNYMQYPNSYQFNSCTNIPISNGNTAQFIQCPPNIMNNNINDISYDPLIDERYSINQKIAINDDDGIKRIERKRERNREAARKCRERKNQHVEVLEGKLKEQKKAMELMQSKMKLVYDEMKRIGDYITKNIPHSDLKEFKRIENEIALCLDLGESEL